MQETLLGNGICLEVKEEANLEIIEAYIYYEDKRIGLGEEFLEHLDTYLIELQRIQYTFRKRGSHIEKPL